MSKQFLIGVALVVACTATAGRRVSADETAAATRATLSAEVGTFLKTYCL